MVNIFTIPIKDPLRSIIDASHSEIKSECTSLLMKWKTIVGNYVTDVIRIDNSSFILALNKNGSLFGVWDLINNEGHVFLVPIDIVARPYFELTRIVVPLSKLQSGTKYMFDIDNNPSLVSIKNHSREILKTMMNSPEYKGWSDQELVIRAIQIANSHHEQFQSFSKLFHDSATEE